MQHFDVLKSIPSYPRYVAVIERQQDHVKILVYQVFGALPCLSVPINKYKLLLKYLSTTW